MGQALYRKYRSRGLEEVVGQEHIVDTLEKAIKSGRISHAYLFTGPKGVGKTSVARILAHEINGLSYDDDSTHLDIIEIDAASNRRIDEIRELRDKVNIAPTSSKYKVYIIDEVHMLTREAFNALLKTLEEPPAHVVFILATTEAHKLPETIVSRTQRFTFKPGTPEKVALHLRHIADKEGIKITDEALALIARHGEGSFRDSVGLLDQAGGQTREIDAAHIQTMLGVPPAEAIDGLAESALQHDVAKVVKRLAQMHAEGYQSAKIAKLLGELWRGRMIEASAGTSEDFALLQKLLEVPVAHEPGRYLEIILLEFAIAGNEGMDQRQGTGSGRDKQPKSSEIDVQPKPSKPITDEAKGDGANEAQAAAAEQPATAVVHAKLDENLWQQALAELKKKHNTLYGVVRMASPKFVGTDTIELGFRFAFHRKRVAEAKNQKIIAQVVKDLSGESVIITCVEASPSAEQPEPEPPASTSKMSSPQAEAAPSPSIASISNIFGGGELLES